MAQADDAIKRRVHRGTTRRVATNPKALETRTGYPIPYDVLNLAGRIPGTDLNLAPLQLNLDTTAGRRIEIGDGTVPRRVDFYSDPAGNAIVFEPPIGVDDTDFWLSYNRYLRDVYLYCSREIAVLTSDGTYVSCTNGGDVKAYSKSGNVALYPLTAGKQVILGSATNGVRVTKEGVLSLVGTARVLNNLRIWPTAFKLPAANFPASDTVSVFDVLDFDDTTEESCYVDVILPYRREQGTDVTVSVYWHSAAAIAGDCIWGIEYNAIADGDAVGGATTTVEEAFTTDGTAGDLSIDTFTTKILAANIDTKNIAGIRLYRKAADALDTLVGDARCMGLNLEFTTDKLGKAL